MDIAKHVAKKFIERSEALGYKGRKRDDAALDFVCGAAAPFAPSSAEYAAITVLILMVSTRGYMGLTEIASRNPVNVDNLKSVS